MSLRLSVFLSVCLQVSVRLTKNEFLLHKTLGTSTVNYRETDAVAKIRHKYRALYVKT